MLSLALQVPLRVAEGLVSGRDGPDGIRGTEDDSRIESVESAAALLGLSPDSNDLLGVSSTTLSVQSVGRCGELARGIRAVLRKGGGGSTLLEWREFVVE